MTREAYEYADGHGIDEVADGVLGELDEVLSGDIRTGDVFSFIDYLIDEYNVFYTSLDFAQ